MAQVPMRPKLGWKDCVTPIKLKEYLNASAFKIWALLKFGQSLKYKGHSEMPLYFYDTYRDLGNTVWKERFSALIHIFSSQIVITIDVSIFANDE